MNQESPRKLLIIEDEPSLVRQLQWGLSDKFEITVATDAEQVDRALLIIWKIPVHS